MSGQLSGRRILVTGAATGIGAAAVQVFAEQEAHVAAVHHRTPPPPQLADVASWWPCDMRDRAQVIRMFDDAVGGLGGLDVLVHAAGLWEPSSPETVTEAEIDSQIATNLKSTIFANQAAFTHMRASGGGSILNLGSSEGVNGNPGAPLYSATKAAVHGWTRAAARAWAQHGITVNSLAPAVDTPGADRLRAHIGPEGAAMLEQRLREVVLIGGKLGDPVRDLGPVLVFLASPGAHFITGQLLAIDGGIMMVGA